MSEKAMTLFKFSLWVILGMLLGIIITTAVTWPPPYLNPDFSLW